MSELAPINFTRGIPAPESFPTDDLIAAASGVLQAHAQSVLQYGPSTGFAPLRDWIAAWQQVEPAQVLLANGSLQIVEFLCFAALMLISPPPKKTSAHSATTSPPPM